MDFSILYDMAAGAARGAERMCGQEGGTGNGLPFQNYIGYPAYIAEYNRILLLTAEADPEVTQYFQGVNLGTAQNPNDTPGHMWKYYAETAAVRLNSLASYLKSKLGLKEKEHEQIADLLTAHLRPSIYQDPANEREVQNIVETIFRSKSLDFNRETDTVAFSTKRYVPDFTFNRIGLAVEIKYCKDKDRESKMIDEINADITGYANRYEQVLFVIYDLGFIRDVPRFSADIEKNPNVKVLVIKK